MKKILMILALIGLITYLFIGCNITTPGENVGTEGEGEGEEEGARVVMVELFVAPACGGCPKAKQDMAQLLEEYGLDKLVVLEEYAWNYPLNSGWATSETINRYKWYTSEGGTPDAYFNGLNQNINRDDSSYYNYKIAIDKELEKPAKVSISASASQDDTIRSVNINGSINNISSEVLNDIIISAIIYEDSVLLGDKTVNHVVRDIITPEESGQIISTFSAGENLEFSLTSTTLNNVKNMDNIHVVVYVQAPNSPTKEILQALYVD